MSPQLQKLLQTYFGAMRHACIRELPSSVDSRQSGSKARTSSTASIHPHERVCYLLVVRPQYETGPKLVPGRPEEERQVIKRTKSESVESKGRRTNTPHREAPARSRTSKDTPLSSFRTVLTGALFIITHHIQHPPRTISLAPTVLLAISNYAIYQINSRW